MPDMMKFVKSVSGLFTMSQKEEGQVHDMKEMLHELIEELSESQIVYTYTFISKLFGMTQKG